MPYAATIARDSTVIGGVAYVVVTVTETGNTGVGDEKEITGLPVIGTVVHVNSAMTLGAGSSATQIDPQLGEVTNSNAVWENTTAGTSMRETQLTKAYYSAAGSLFWRAKADGTLGTNGTIVSTIVVRLGNPG
jgi:hypothetical protein